MSDAWPIDADRVLADLRDLHRRTGGPDGAQRVCWTTTWQDARGWLRERLDGLGASIRVDEAGNLWGLLPGSGEGTVAVGSHTDSVPGGGWLDGVLGVVAALEVLRVAAGSGGRRRSLALVDWADEEGVRFGHSCFGSSAATGALDAAGYGERRDRDGNAAADVLGSWGLDLETVALSAVSLTGLSAYVELHIEQGPVLEAEGQPFAVVNGTAGLRRLRVTFEGRSGHAGTTPMELRHDAGLAAAELTLEVERVVSGCEGRGTVGVCELDPNVPTVVPGRARLTIDLRHPDAPRLDAMEADVRGRADDIARRRGCTLEVEPLSSAEPSPFDSPLVDVAQQIASPRGGRPTPMVSWALHDATELARRVPTVMVFAPSRGGISHAFDEDTDEADLRVAIESYGAIVQRLAER